MEASRVSHLARAAPEQACACCKAPTEAAQGVRCPRCHATTHMECVWDSSPCAGCGYDLEDEARRQRVAWLERSAQWVIGFLPTRWSARTRAALVSQRSIYGSLFATSILLTILGVVVVRILLELVS